MNSLHRSLPLLALLAVTALSCTSTTNTVETAPGIAPTITRFSPESVWTSNLDTIYGTNFGYDPSDVLVTIDTTRVEVTSADDTVLTVLVPESARSGLIHVRTYEQTAASAKPLVIRYTFTPHTFVDTLPEGASFAIPGTGLNNYHWPLLINLNGMALPIDSIFPDRIVSHIVPSGYSGTLAVSDSVTTYSVGTIYVTRPSTWNTLSQIWDRLTISEYHHLTGYIPGVTKAIDSAWVTKAVYDHQTDMNVSGKLFTKTARGVNYSVPATIPYYTYPLLQVFWDTVSQAASVILYSNSVSQPSPLHTIDTLWYIQSSNLPAAGSLSADVEFTPPSVGYSITESMKDSTGLVNWQETTTGSLVSGSFDLILKR